MISTGERADGRRQIFGAGSFGEHVGSFLKQGPVLGSFYKGAVLCWGA